MCVCPPGFGYDYHLYSVCYIRPRPLSQLKFLTNAKLVETVQLYLFFFLIQNISFFVQFYTFKRERNRGSIYNGQVQFLNGNLNEYFNWNFLHIIVVIVGM